MLSAWSAGSRQQAGLHQGPQQGDGTCGVAAGVADALRAGNARGLRRIHLRKAVNPLRVRAVGRAGVDHAHGGVVGGGHGFAGGGVGQAQNGDVAAIDGFGAWGSCSRIRPVSAAAGRCRRAGAGGFAGRWCASGARCGRPALERCWWSGPGACWPMPTRPWTWCGARCRGWRGGCGWARPPAHPHAAGAAPAVAPPGHCPPRGLGGARHSACAGCAVAAEAGVTRSGTGNAPPEAAVIAQAASSPMSNRVSDT